MPRRRRPSLPPLPPRRRLAAARPVALSSRQIPAEGPAAGLPCPAAETSDPAPAAPCFGGWPPRGGRRSSATRSTGSTSRTCVDAVRAPAARRDVARTTRPGGLLTGSLSRGADAARLMDRLPSGPVTAHRLLLHAPLCARSWSPTIAVLSRPSTGCCCPTRWVTASRPAPRPHRTLAAHALIFSTRSASPRVGCRPRRRRRRRVRLAAAATTRERAASSGVDPRRSVRPRQPASAPGLPSPCCWWRRVDTRAPRGLPLAALVTIPCIGPAACRPRGSVLLWIPGM